MFCPNCGAELSAGAKFCSKCGQGVSSTPKTNSFRDRFAKATGAFSDMAKSVGKAVNDATDGKAGDMFQSAQEKVRGLGVTNSSGYNESTDYDSKENAVYSVKGNIGFAYGTLDILPDSLVFNSPKTGTVIFTYSEINKISMPLGVINLQCASQTVGANVDKSIREEVINYIRERIPAESLDRDKRIVDKENGFEFYALYKGTDLTRVFVSPEQIMCSSDKLGELTIPFNSITGFNFNFGTLSIIRGEEKIDLLIDKSISGEAVKRIMENVSDETVKNSSNINTLTVGDYIGFGKASVNENDSDFVKKVLSLPGADTWGTKRDILELEKVILEGEDVKAIVSGNNDDKVWLIACTDRRIIAVNKNIILGKDQVEAPYKQVTGISVSTGAVFATISIQTGFKHMKITNVEKNSAMIFVDKVHKELEEYEKKTATPVQVIQQSAPTSNADEIKKYKELLDIGAITQEEFDAKKKQLLGL